MTTNPQPDLPARLEAALTERFTELGNPFSAMRRHEQGPDGWPASHPVGPHQVAEVLRELLAVSVPASAPTDRTERCVCGEPTAPDAVHRTDGPCYIDNRIRVIATAIARVDIHQWADGEPLEDKPLWQAYLSYARAVLPVLPAPADRAAVYAEVADRLAADAEQGDKDGLTRIYRRSAATQVRGWADELRHVAGETQQPAPWLSDSARIGRTLIWSWTDIGKGAYGKGYRDAQAQVRSLLGGPDSGETQQPETQAEVECANCWRLVENRGTPNMGGPPHDKWVHVPGGFTVCFPQRGADSPRAEPRPAAVSQPDEEA